MWERGNEKRRKNMLVREDARRKCGQVIVGKSRGNIKERKVVDWKGIDFNE